jgi:prolipoprotein diacylglyceryltransferase
MVGETAATGAMVGGFVIFFIIMWFVMAIVGIIGFIFWIFMIVDVAKRNFKNENDKILWILVVILAGIIGALIYYFVIKKPNKN